MTADKIIPEEVFMSKIDDVARLAKVSKGTVSNVFSGKRPTSEDVRRRVFKAAKELNYTPNHIARSLVTKETMIIGLKIPFAQNKLLGGLHTKLVNGVIAQAALNNYRVLIDTSPPEGTDIKHLSTDPMDGVIVMDPEKEDIRVEILKERGAPFVVVGVPHDATDVPYVNNNNVEVTTSMTELLIKNGHRKILFLNAPVIKTVSEDRKHGFYQGFEKQLVPYDESYNIYKEDQYEDSSLYGYRMVKYYFEDKKEMPFTAIITDTDAVAVGVLRALRELALNVPEDISVVALSDDLANALDPPLTTVNLYPERLGREAVKLLIEQIKARDLSMNTRVIVPAQIIERTSVKKRDNL